MFNDQEGYLPLEPKNHLQEKHTMSGKRVRSLSCLLDTSDEYTAVGAAADHSWRAWRRRRGDGAIAASVLTALLIVGTVLGFVLPASDELHGPYRRISAIIGWTYFSRLEVLVLQAMPRYKNQRSRLSEIYLLYN